MCRIGVVILSRFNSSRLPGKALKLVQGKPVLSYIIERIMQVVPPSRITIATSLEIEDEAIVQLAESMHIRCYRGSLENVSLRFLEAGESLGVEFVVRINGDNFFVDVNLLKKMIEVAESGEYDFISNVYERTFPKGMSIEIVRLAHYRRMQVYMQSLEYREHVTLHYYKENFDVKVHRVLNTDFPEAAGLQLALDTQDDLDRTRRLVSLFTREHWRYSMRDIINLERSMHS